VLQLQVPSLILTIVYRFRLGTLMLATLLVMPSTLFSEVYTVRLATTVCHLPALQPGCRACTQTLNGKGAAPSVWVAKTLQELPFFFGVCASHACAS
jgi:hypothetical protein